MANDNPMGSGSLVSLDLPPQHQPIMRDLETPDEVQRPDQAWQEARAFERLLTAISTGKICLPDEAARTAIEASAAAHDRESGYTEAVAIHDALHSLLDVLGGPCR